MVFSTKGIVLHRFKYSDNKTIVKIYTEEFGMQSYLIYGASSKKAKQILSILQPLFLVDMQVYHNEKKDLQKIKEISNSYPFKSIPFNIYKNSIGLFLSEFLMKVLNESDGDNKDLFKFLFKAIKTFDTEKEYFVNFHIIVLFMITELLGISPNNNFSEGKNIFDLTAGKFITGIPIHKNYLNVKQSDVFYKLFSYNLDNFQELKINNSERRILLNTLTKFYTIHLGKPGNLQTLKVLQEIF